MKRKRFATEQIIKILKEAELGIKSAELFRKYGIAEQAFYNWRNKYGGMDISLDNQVLKDLLLTPKAKRQTPKLMNLNRSTSQYKPVKLNILVLANLQTMPSLRVSTASFVMNV